MTPRSWRVSALRSEPQPSRKPDLSTTQLTIHVPDNHLMGPLLGQRDELLRMVEAAFPDADIHVRGNEVAIGGSDADRAGRVFGELVTLVQSGQTLDATVVARAIDMVSADERPSEVLTHEVLRAAHGRRVRPKTAGQKRYVDTIADNIITFGLGPAGTGKSWLAVAMAVRALHAKQVDRIILTRPAVEAGERLGFLPGDLMDEAQNTTPEQMKMFLTRIGFGSRAVITGDTTQVDVSGGRSGLAGLERVLGGIDGLAFVHLSGRDVVRHQIVADIVSAYERDAARPDVGPAQS